LFLCYFAHQNQNYYLDGNYVGIKALGKKCSFLKALKEQLNVYYGQIHQGLKTCANNNKLIGLQGPHKINPESFHLTPMSRANYKKYIFVRVKNKRGLINFSMNDICKKIKINEKE
jgi:hypothetical protein